MQEQGIKYVFESKEIKRKKIVIYLEHKDKRLAEEKREQEYQKHCGEHSCVEYILGMTSEFPKLKDLFCSQEKYLTQPTVLEDDGDFYIGCVYRGSKLKLPYVAIMYESTEDGIKAAIHTFEYLDIAEEVDIDNILTQLLLQYPRYQGIIK